MENLAGEVASRIAGSCVAQADVRSCIVYHYDAKTNALERIGSAGSATQREGGSVLLQDLTQPLQGNSITNSQAGYSEIVIPIGQSPGTIGIIYAEKDQADFFTDSCRQTLETIASLSAPLMDASLQFKNRADLRDLEQKKEAERVKSEFLDQVSHEMRTSLTLIIGPLNEMIQSSKNPEEAAQLESLLTHAKKLQSITNGMFEYTSFHKRDNDSDIAESLLAMDSPSTYVDLDVQSKKPVVVITEDSDQLRRFLNQILIDEFTLIETSNGLEGLQAAIEHVPDLIISDIMMPKMDGLELCEKIKSMEITSHIPVLLLTALADLDSRLEGLETGADYYLGKPFEPRELLTASHNLIAQRKKLRDHFAKKLLLKTQEWEGVSADERFLQKLMTLIEKHLADPDFTIEELQKDMGISRMQLHRKLKALTDKSATEFIRTIRLKRAAEMLQKGQDNVSQVAYQVGFNSLSYFTKCFKEQFGVLPSAFS